MNRRDGGSTKVAFHGLAGVIVLGWSVLGLASCQALGSSGLTGTSGASPGGSGRPLPTAVASPSAVPTATSTSIDASPPESPLSGDAASAAQTVRTYLDALTAGRYQDAWQVLAPSAQQAWGSEQNFATERGAFYASAGATVVLSAPDNLPQTLGEWIPPNFDGDRQRAYVVNVDHPVIETNASREVLVAAPDSSGAWHLWVGR